MQEQRGRRSLEFGVYTAAVVVALWLQRRPLGRDPEFPNLQAPSPVVGLVYTAAGVALLGRYWPQPTSGRRIGFLALGVLLLIVGLSDLTRYFGSH